MIKFLLRFLLISLTTTCVLFIIQQYFPELGFSIRSTSAGDLPMIQNIGGLVTIGILIRIGMEIVASILKILTFPLKRFTLGVSNLIINVVVLYSIEYILRYHLEVGYEIQLGNILQTSILSFFLSFILGVLTYVIKRFI